MLGSSPDWREGGPGEVRAWPAPLCATCLSRDEVLAAVDAARDAMGGIDGVFVNAGIDGQGLPAAELDVDHFRRVLDVNVIGAFLVARTALRGSAAAIVDRVQRVGKRVETGAQLPRLQRQQGGRRKHGQVAGHGGERKGYAVTALCPGLLPDPNDGSYLDDPGTRDELLARIPAGRFGDLEEVAALVEFLLSPQAAFMTGSVVSIDGGASI